MCRLPRIERLDFLFDGAAISSKLRDRDPLIRATSRTSVNLKFPAVELKGDANHALVHDIPRCFVRSELGISTWGVSYACNDDMGPHSWQKIATLSKKCGPVLA